MTKEEQALEYLRLFQQCSFSEKNRPSLDQGMGFVFMYLDQKDKTTAKELSGAMGVSMARITAIIKNMEDKGYIKREVSDTDARVSYIYLSEEGMLRKNRITEYAIHVIKDIMDSVGTEEINHFLMTASKIKEVISKSQNENPVNKGGASC